MPLLAMEHGELISIVTSNGGYPFGQVNPAHTEVRSPGRPSTIRPGKPVLKHVFQRLVDGGHLSSLGIHYA